MYRYNFECERILLEIVDNLISVKDEDFKVNIVITEKYLLVFKNVNDDSILKAKGISEMPDYELIIKIDLNNIDYEVDDNNTVIDFNNQEIILYNFDLNNVKTGLFCDNFVSY